MRVVNIHKAKAQLSKWINVVSSGEEIIITKAGKPIARLSPFRVQKPKRKPGTFKGELWVADDFDAPLPNYLMNNPVNATRLTEAIDEIEKVIVKDNNK